MASARYSRGGFASKHSQYFLAFWWSSDNKNKLFLFYKNVATRGKISENRALDLIRYLAEETFYFYYVKYAKNPKLSAAEKKYLTVKMAFVDCFNKVEAPVKNIYRAINSCLNFDDFPF